MKSNRRTLLKALTAGGGAVAASKLPTAWSTPAVESVLLPAHAQTTGGSPLSGGTTLLLGQNNSNRFDSYARVESSTENKSIIDKLISPAHAGQEQPKMKMLMDNLLGYAEPAGGDSWFIQILHRFEDNYNDGQNEQLKQDLLDALVGPAQAGQAGDRPQMTCTSEILWQGTVHANVQANDKSWGSDWITGISPADTCGDPFFFGPPPHRIDMRLADMNNPTDPDYGNLVFRNMYIDKKRIPMTRGGSRLAVDCMGMPCEIEK